MNSRLVEQPQLAGQVGNDHDRSLEHGDQQQLLAGVVGLDVAGELGEPAPDVLGGHQHADARRALSRRCRGDEAGQPPRLGGAVRAGGHAWLSATGTTAILPERRMAATPPGSPTGPCPCQRVTRASRASTCAAVRPGARRCSSRPRSAGGRAERTVTSDGSATSSASRSSRSASSRSSRALVARAAVSASGERPSAVASVVHRCAHPAAGEGGVRVGRVGVGLQPLRGAGVAGWSRGRGRAAGGGSGRGRRPSRRGCARPIRGRVPAARSPPGRRGCDRAARPAAFGRRQRPPGRHNAQCARRLRRGGPGRRGPRPRRRAPGRSGRPSRRQRDCRRTRPGRQRARRRWRARTPRRPPARASPDRRRGPPPRGATGRGRPALGARRAGRRRPPGPARSSQATRLSQSAGASSSALDGSAAGLVQTFATASAPPCSWTDALCFGQFLQEFSHVNNTTDPVVPDSVPRWINTSFRARFRDSDHVEFLLR